MPSYLPCRQPGVIIYASDNPYERRARKTQSGSQSVGWNHPGHAALLLHRAADRQPGGQRRRTITPHCYRQPGSQRTCNHTTGHRNTDPAAYIHLYLHPHRHCLANRHGNGKGNLPHPERHAYFYRNAYRPAPAAQRYAFIYSCTNGDHSPNAVSLKQR